MEATGAPSATELRELRGSSGIEADAVSALCKPSEVVWVSGQATSRGGATSASKDT